MCLFYASKLGYSYHWRVESSVSLVFMASGCGFTLGGPPGLPSRLWAKPDVASLAHNGGPNHGGSRSHGVSENFSHVATVTLLTRIAVSYLSLVGCQLGLAQCSGPPHSHSTRVALPLWSGLPSWKVQGTSIPLSESGLRPLWGQQRWGT